MDWPTVSFPTAALLFGGCILLGLLVVFLAQTIQNARSPLVQFPARVIAKRSKVSGGGGGPGNYTSTSYFVTFENEFGDWREWEMQEELYGLLVEGDKGTLTTQGEWFKGFTRNRKKPKEGRGV